MVKNVLIKAASDSHVSGEYQTPKIEVVQFQPEGVLCASVYNDHQGFQYDGEETL